ncbi:unnamed protein product [Didymodactylos carnosus]|uniref:Uncharacterized protein n=1 Tax=Didymodactylos carnosus TaxID=1234261 RepID=A0A814GZT2_9BILA|nr:unnamed protein product [Didymodactylos carnosus]CAF1039381.1 unnamed protein product [Didymodactylos carnosus]CAF3774605.1 unnamed protein product [Didymodactylos carnosus]CAF3807544.1 unnamed protein product [Didymodactylos carnosus]
MVSTMGSFRLDTSNAKRSVYDTFFKDSLGTGYLLKGVILSFLHRYNEAHEALDEVLCMTDYKDYQLESRLHFRANAAISSLKQMDDGIILKKESKKLSILNKKTNEIRY